MIKKNWLLVFLIFFLICLLLVYGESGLNFNINLIRELRLPKIVVCLMAGGMLSLSGLIMQIFFQNPLAGPDILGVSAGSSLFMAFWMMASEGTSSIVTNLGGSVMSFIGAITVFLLLLFFVQKNMSRVSLIIIGLLISSFASSGISILVSMSQALQLKNYLSWSMGSFRATTSSELPLFILLSLFSIIPVFFFAKPLEQFLLSENYAKSMGVNVKKMRMLFVLMAAFSISIVTHFCGPIGFIGIISPHLAKHFLKSSKLSQLIPAVFMMGTILALITEVILVFNPNYSLSVNAILGLIGSPVIVFYFYRQREWSL